MAKENDMTKEEEQHKIFTELLYLICNNKKDISFQNGLLQEVQSVQRIIFGNLGVNRELIDNLTKQLIGEPKNDN